MYGLDILHLFEDFWLTKGFVQMALSVPSTLVLLYLPTLWGISGVWVGLTTVMTLRMLAGLWRYVASLYISYQLHRHDAAVGNHFNISSC